jgi:hypothetical protein
MQPDDFTHGAGEQAERISIPEIGFNGEREPGNVFNIGYVVRRDAPFFHPFAE